MATTTRLGHYSFELEVMGMGDVDWGRLFAEVVNDSGDVVDVAHVIRRHSSKRSDQYVAVIALRERCGLSTSQTIEVLAWLAGDRTDDELRREVDLRGRQER